MNKVLRLVILWGLLGSALTVSAEPGVHICNGSRSIPVYIAKAWQKGYAGNYVVSGWHRLQPAPNKLFRQCSTLGAGFASPVYVAVVHADGTGAQWLYEYEFEAYGGIYKKVNRPLCVNINDSFEMNAGSREELANCPAGMNLMPFTMRINPPGDSDDITFYVAEEGAMGTPISPLAAFGRTEKPSPKAKAVGEDLAAKPVCGLRKEILALQEQRLGKAVAEKNSANNEWDLDLLMNSTTNQWIVLGMKRPRESNARACIMAQGDSNPESLQWYKKYFSSVRWRF